MDPKRRQYLEAQLSAYLDDELTTAERAEVEAFLAADADARKLLTELEATTAGLRALPRAKVSPDLMEGLRSRLERRALLGDQPSKAPSASTIPFSGRWLAAAAVVVMMVTTGYVMYSFRSPEPASRNKDYALVEPAVRPGARLTEGETRLPSAPSVRYGREKAEQAVSEGREAGSKNRALDMTIEPSATLSPTAKPAKGESSVAVASKTLGGTPGRAAGETLAGTEPVAAPPAQPVTVVADFGADSVVDRLSKEKGDELGLAARDDKAAKKPAAKEDADLGDKVVAAAGGRRGEPSASRSLKGIPADEQLRSRAVAGASRPAMVQREMPAMAAQVAKGKLESGRALTRGETATPSAPAVGQTEAEAKIADLSEKAEPSEQAGAIANAAVGIESVSNVPAEATPETERVAREVALDRSASVREGGGQGGGQARAGQMKESLEGLVVGELAGGAKDSTGRGYGGGMGGFGGYQEGTFGRGRQGGAYGDDYDAMSNRGVLGEYFTDGRPRGALLFAAPLLGEPPWRPDENAPVSVARSCWWAGFQAGTPLTFDLPDTAKSGDATFKFGQELGQAAAGGTFVAGQDTTKAAGHPSLGRPASAASAAGKPATQPASAPATAPASQPASPPAKPPSQTR